MERRLCTDVAGEKDEQHESNHGVDVHAELEWRQMEACEQGKEPIQARDFIQEQSECAQLGAGPKRHEVEE